MGTCPAQRSAAPRRLAPASPHRDLRRHRSCLRAHRCAPRRRPSAQPVPLRADRVGSARPGRQPRGRPRQHLRSQRQRSRGLSQSLEHLGRPSQHQGSERLRSEARADRRRRRRDARDHPRAEGSRVRLCRAQGREQRRQGSASTRPAGDRLRPRDQALLPVRIARGTGARLRRHRQPRPVRPRSGCSDGAGRTPWSHGSRARDRGAQAS